MGLTKQYLAYKHIGSFNIISSGRANINFVIYNRIEGRYVVAPAAESVILWDMKLGQKVLQFVREKHEVTALRVSPDRLHVAVGYDDGTVQIFEIESQEHVMSLALHKSAISVLRYNESGICLISGSLDTEVVISDVVEQTGKHRLVGHNAPVTDAHFLEHLKLNNVVVTSSKDTQIKFWNLETRTCFKTIVDNRSEVWTIAFAGEFLVAGSKENTLNMYRIKMRKPKSSDGDTNVVLIEGLTLDDEDVVSPIDVTNCGVIQRSGKGRTVNIVADKSKRVLNCHGTDDIVESFYFRTYEEAKSHLTKRLKKTGGNEKVSTELCLTDEIKRLPTLKTRNKIKSIDLLLGKQDELRVILSCANNSLHMYSVEVRKKKDPELLRSISKCGHQSEIRAVCFSSDSVAVASGSAESIKLWNRNSMQSLRTVSTNYVLCLCFAPGDRHLLAGLKTGNLIIVDVGTGEIIEEIPAHKNEIWSICMLPNLKCCVTGSGDTTVKIWSFELIESSTAEDGVAKPKVLSLLHKNTLKVEEAVLAVKISPNGKFLSVALLDSTIKIFFLDSFKFYLSLYGHKLPVLCMDISYDSNLIVTGSADRNIKIWGLDFGNCHKSLLAHDDSVIGLQFIPSSHMFFSCGKDGKIKQWDADSFDKIITLPGHIGEAYGISVSPNARYLVSCGSDRCLRLFERTDEPIILQDVQEEEREELENRTLATGEESDIPTLPRLKLPSRKTIGSEKSAELILECLDIIKTFEESDNSEIHPLMMACQTKTPDNFLIAILQNIRASDLEEALLLLPFSHVCQILERVSQLAENRNDQAELLCKVVLFLLRLHYKSIVSNQILFQIMNTIIKKLQSLVVELRDLVGMNYYSLQLFQRDVEELEGIELFEDAGKIKKRKDKKFKRRQQAKRLHIQMI